MFEVNDANGKKLWIKDKIRHTYIEGPEEKQREGIVICFPEENKVQYEPIKDGLPVICYGKELVQVDSLAERALSLKGEEDFQQLIKDATERYLIAVADGKKKKAGSRGGTKKAAPKITQTELNDMGIDLGSL